MTQQCGVYDIIAPPITMPMNPQISDKMICAIPWPIWLRVRFTMPMMKEARAKSGGRNSKAIPAQT
jgi:hypothetical protein